VARDGLEQDFNVTPIDNPDLARARIPTVGSATESTAAPLRIDR